MKLMDKTQSLRAIFYANQKPCANPTGALRWELPVLETLELQKQLSSPWLT